MKEIVNIDKTGDLMRIRKTISGSYKYAVINSLGDEIVPPLYDYIAPIINANCIKVFIGEYKWDWNEYDGDLFYDKIFPNSWNGDDYKGSLGKGFWGFIDSDNNTVLPVSYNWVEQYNDNVLLFNLDGSQIIKWYDGDDKEVKWSIVGGIWIASYINGEKIIEGNFCSKEYEFAKKLQSLEKSDKKYWCQSIHKH